MKHLPLLIFIPTYNEKDNVLTLYEHLKSLNLAFDILFCDDNSPDHTGAILDDLAARDAHVGVLHRSYKMGLGTAHRTAFEYAYAHNYSMLLTMDADGTHDPDYIPIMLQKSSEADIVIGSRYVQGGGMRKWGSFRLALTYLWKTLIGYGLGLHYDATTAFRLYKVSILKPELCKKFISKEFSFNIENLYHFKRTGAQIVEIPIVAHNRVYGQSKLSTALMLEEAALFLKLLFNRLLD